MRNPGKINMKPENPLFEKEKSSSAKPPWLNVSILIFQGINRQIPGGSKSW